MRSINLHTLQNSRRLRLAYVIDPRFPGGTSSAVAAELVALAFHHDITVHAIDSTMFAGREVAPQLQEAIDACRIQIKWQSDPIQADVIIIHNPSLLRFDDTLPHKLIAHHIIVVTHENFLRPNGHPGFDVQKCLSLIEKSSLSTRKTLAPISPWNRETVVEWTAQNAPHWSILNVDWFNIFQQDHVPPSDTPSDRRGRVSRPGPEKFPNLDDLNVCFPSHAKSNIILGADGLADVATDHPHWRCYDFGTLELADFFRQVDFVIHYTSPNWRESFGRVIAESITAGKVVITDPLTAKNFGAGTIGATLDDIDKIIAHFIETPQTYIDHVVAAQKKLARFSADSFRQTVLPAAIAPVVTSYVTD